MDSPLSKPRRIDRYDIVSVIGRGGMGTVFKASDPRIGRLVAIKVLTAAADDPELLQRFYREATYTGSLQHQNIVTVYELGHEDGVPYLVMEYLEGVSLDAMIESRNLMPMAEKLRIILQVCAGLSYAHKRGLVHRDIKPANIVILEDNTAKIVDFGIAQLEGNRLTRPGHAMGSLFYMSPEQLDGGVELDLRTDVYSTGVVLFQLLTGVLPFKGSTTAGTLRKIVQDPPPPLTQYLKDCPAELETIVQRVLAKNREDRYASADDFAVDVGRAQQRYETHLLSDYLQQAAESLRRKDFATARQQVLQVLRVSPQNTEGNELFRLIKQGLDLQQCEQQAVQVQMKAEEAFRKNEFDKALQFIEEGLQLDSSRTPFLRLRDEVSAAQAKAVKYLEIVQHGESALRYGDLEAAKQSAEEAVALLPEEPAGKKLAGQVAARITQRRQQEKAAQVQKQFALAVSVVEKAMADAHMLLFLGQVPEALQALDKVSDEVSQLPPKWREQVESLKREAEAKTGMPNQPPGSESLGSKSPFPESMDWGGSHASQTAEMPNSFSATDLMERQWRFDEGAVLEGGPADAHQETQSFRDTSIFRPQPPAENPPIAPELLEFLEPEPKNWFSSPMIWLGTAGSVLLAVVLWVIIRPAPESRSHLPSAPPMMAASYTYAEINAEPWAMIKELIPESGESQSAIGSPTPLRVKLPPGRYSVTLEGPNHEQKQVVITVPTQGGTTCFVLFRKPDLERLLRLPSKVLPPTSN